MPRGRSRPAPRTAVGRRRARPAGRRPARRGLRWKKSTTPASMAADDRDDVAESIEHAAEPIASRDRVTDVHGGLPPAGSRGARPRNRSTSRCPVSGGSGAPSSTTAARSVPRRPRTWRSTSTGSSRPRPPRLGDEARDPSCRRGHARGPPERVSGVAHHVAQPERPGQPLRGLAHRRVVVKRERLKRLDHVAAVQVDEHIAAGHELGEDVMGEHLGERPVRVSRKGAIEGLDHPRAPRREIAR